MKIISHRLFYWLTSALVFCVLGFYFLGAFYLVYSEESLGRPLICANGEEPLYSKVACEKAIYLYRGTKTDIDTINFDGNGLLYVVGMHDKKQAERILKFFLNHGININQQYGDSKLTVLHMVATDSEAEQEVTLMLAHGAQKNIKDKWGRTPLDILEDFQKKHHKTYLEPVVKLLAL